KKQPSKKAQRQEAEVPQDEGEHEESVPTPSNDPQPSGEDSLQLTDLMVLCTKLQTRVLVLQKAKDAWNGYLRKGRKTKPKRQNQTRNGKAWKRHSQVQAQV
ncbi:hypothetical protein Tco_0520008, partial [Tanacetum coccineum]